MKFGLVHRVMTDSLAVLGIASLLSGDQLHPVVAWLLVLGLIGALLVPERWQERRWFAPAIRGGVIGLLVLQVARGILGGSLLPLSVEFAAGLQLIRLASRRGAAHDQHVILLALLHLIAGTVLGGGISYGLCFLGLLIVAPGALVLSHLRREVEGNYRQGARDRTGLPVNVPRILRSRRVIGKQFLVFTCLMSVPIFVFTVALFLMFPRVGLSLLLLQNPTQTRMTGFSERVDLGDVGKINVDPRLVLRVEPPDLPENPPERTAFYLRGAGQDLYDGRSWIRSDPRQGALDRRGSRVRLVRWARPTDTALTIEIEPMDPTMVFLPQDTVALEMSLRTGTVGLQAPAFTQGTEEEVRYTATDDRGLRFTAFVAPPGELSYAPLSAEDRLRYTALPPELPPRIAELARTWAGDAPRAADKAARIEERLKRDYRYDLESPSGGQPQPLDHFLFESRRGHCEYYSTAMAVMLRSLGVPARNVTGFAGGTWNRFGRFYAVRRSDAHSWVEAFVEGRGWTRYDPTPPATSTVAANTGVVNFFRDIAEAASQRWSRHVVGYDLGQQLWLLQRTRRSYSQWSRQSVVLAAARRSPSRTAAIAGGLLLVALGGWLFWRSRRARQRGGPARDAERALREVTELYRLLESSLAARGAARQPAIPPLTHARALVGLGHPAGAEALALTHLYVEARFGERALTAEEQREFARRARALARPPAA